MKLIKSNKPSLIAGHGFRIVPGINQMPDAAWERAKDTRVIKQMLKDKVLIDQTPKELKEAPALEAPSIETDEEDDRPRQPSALKAVGQKKAIELVGETLDLQLLEDWRAQDDRPKVLAAIKAQIGRIQAETKKPKEKEPDEIETDELSGEEEV